MGGACRTRGTCFQCRRLGFAGRLHGAVSGNLVERNRGALLLSDQWTEEGRQVRSMYRIIRRLGIEVATAFVTCATIGIYTGGLP